MIILGIDPALGTTGFGVINYLRGQPEYIFSGTIKTSSSELITLRLYQIANKLEQIIVEHQPEIIAMEETFVNMNAVSSLKLGYARGAIMSLVGRHNINFREFKPNFIKKTIVGVGHAEKHQVLHMIKILIKNMPDQVSLDEADALAVACVCSRLV